MELGENPGAGSAVFLLEVSWGERFLASCSSERPLHPLARGPLFHLQSREAVTSASAVTSPSLTLSPPASLMRTPVMTLGFPWVTQHLRREADLQGAWSHGWRVPMT